LLTFSIVALAFSAGAQQAAPAGSWSFTLTPYLWLPTINGDLKYDVPAGDGGGILDVELGPNDYLSNLQAIAMVAGEARKGRGSIVSDLVYLDFSGEKSHVRSVDFGDGEIPVGTSVNVDTETSLKGLEWTLAGGYAMSGNPDATLDLVAGVRYLSLDTSAAWNLTGTIDGSGQSLAREGRVSNETDLWDGIVGVRGRVKLGERWSMPYHLDAGAGSSSLTWQALLGVTYAYGWGDVGLVYRHLEVRAEPELQRPRTERDVPLLKLTTKDKGHWRPS
jgi:hypothetical protein